MNCVHGCHHYTHTNNDHNTTNQKIKSTFDKLLTLAERYRQKEAQHQYEAPLTLSPSQGRTTE